MKKIALNFWSKEALIEVLIFPTPSTIINHLSNSNSLLIVPYDCDKNFEPCNHNGKFAHWAVIVSYFCLFYCLKLLLN